MVDSVAQVWLIYHMTTNEHSIKNLITGQYVTGFDWENDTVRWGYSLSDAVRFSSKANAELALREYGLGGGWVVPSPRPLTEVL